MTRRLLAVSWELPPMYGPRAAQVSRTLRSLADLDWAPTVIAMAPRAGGPHWRDAVPADPIRGVEVIRVPSPEEWWPIRAAWRLLPALRDRPDSKWVWIGRAQRAAMRATSTASFAGLVTFGQPWSDHLIGLHVSRAAGLPWVAHFSDPWVDSPYAEGSARQRAAWHRMEADVIGNADGVVFVTAETAELVMRKYPGAWRNKVSIVPHGYVPVPAGASGARRLGPLRLVHTGRFYSGIRTPRAVLQALAVLHAQTPLTGVLELTLVGPHQAEFKDEGATLVRDGVVRFHDRVTPAAAGAIAADADALLVIDAPSEGPSVFLPSKLIDYLPLRKPIIGVTPPVGASASLLNQLGCRVASPDDVAAIAGAIADLIAAGRAGTLAVSSTFDTVAAAYDIRRTTAQLNEALMRAFAR